MINFFSAVAEVRQHFRYTQVCKKVIFSCLTDDDSYFQLFLRMNKKKNQSVLHNIRFPNNNYGNISILLERRKGYTGFIKSWMAF